MKNIFLTGAPGVGKTTVLLKVVESLGLKAGGFFTREIRKGGKRIGFAVQDFSGQKGALAGVDIKSPYRVGKYGVDLGTFEGIGVRAVEDAIKDADLIVIDEIGKMELFSRRFQESVVRALDGPKPVLGTIIHRPHLFADTIKQRPDVEIIRVTLENRASLTGRIKKELVNRDN